MKGTLEGGDSFPNLAHRFSFGSALSWIIDNV